MKKLTTGNGILITGADLPTGMGVARSLRGLGVPLTGLTRNRKSAFARSRLWDRLEYVGPDPDPARYLEALRRVGEASSGPIALFPTQDEVVQAVSDSREELARWYRIVLPSKETVDTFMDKTKFHAWALAHGFPVPDSRVAASPRELTDALDALGFPLVVKPLYRTRAWQLRGRHKVYKLTDRAAFDALDIDWFREAPRFIVQRWIDGPDSDVHFCLACWSRDGEELACYTGRKLLQWPPGTGSTAICVGTDNEEVRRLTREIFRTAGYRGLGSVEFKYSAAQKKYFITEPTVGRHNLQSYVAATGGLDLSRIAYRDAMGEPQPAPRRARPAVWIEEHFALRALMAMTDPRVPVLRALALAVLGGAAVSFAYFRWLDPAPFGALCWSLVFE